MWPCDREITLNYLAGPNVITGSYKLKMEAKDSQSEGWTAGGPHVPKRWWLAILFPKNTCSHRKVTSPSQETLVHATISALWQNKSYKTLHPTWLSGWTIGFWVLLHVPPCRLSFLFSTNETFLTFAAGVRLWFPSKSRTSTLIHLKIPAYQEGLCLFR
jgi:hypothetical protein